LKRHEPTRPRSWFANLLDIAEGGVNIVDAQQRIVLFNRGTPGHYGRNQTLNICTIPMCRQIRRKTKNEDRQSWT